MKRALVILLCIVTPFLSQNAFSQDIDYIEDEGKNLWEEQRFIDPSGAEFETSSGEYIGEEEVQALEDAAKSAQLPTLDLASALEKDKALLPDNVVYGLGTGVTIGGWFALFQGKNARDNTRYLGVGIVVGTMLGVMVGTKSVFVRSAKLEKRQNPKQEHFLDRITFGPNTSQPTSMNSLAQLNYNLRF